MKRKESMRMIILQSGLLWGGMPVLWSFMPGYLEGSHFTASQIGILMAVNPLSAILIQPLVGIYADRTSSKNTVLIWLLTGTVLSLILFPAGISYVYVFGVMLLLSVFQAALIPLSVSISLESLDHIGKSYAPVRMSGTIVYSVMAITIGWISGFGMKNIFYTTAIVLGLNAMAIWWMPHVRGHQNKDGRFMAGELFHDKRLRIYTLFALVAMMLMSFFYTFMPIRFLQLGGESDGLGWIFFIAAMSEVPFLIWADRIIDKLGNRILLAGSMLAIGLRLLLLAYIQTTKWLYPIAVFNGIAFIVFNYALSVYINRTVRKELKTTGQTLLTLSMGIGSILGTSAGGLLIDGIGFNTAMKVSFGLSVLAIILFLWRDGRLSNMDA